VIVIFGTFKLITDNHNKKVFKGLKSNLGEIKKSLMLQ